MALIPTRQALLLMAAAGVAAPVVWWALDSSDRSVDAAGRPDMAAGTTDLAVETPAGVGPDGAAGAAVPRVAYPTARSAGELSRGPMGSSRVALVGLDSSGEGAANPLGVLLHGELRTEVPGLTGSVLINAHGPDGRVLDAGGTIGEAYSLLGLTVGEWELVLRGRAILEQRSFITIQPDEATVECDLLVQPAPVVDVLFYTSWGERLEAVLAEPGRDPAGFPQLEIVDGEGRGREDGPRFRRARVPEDLDAPLPEVSGWLELRTAPPVEVRVIQAGRELARREILDPEQPLEFVIDPLEESGRPALTATFIDAVSGAAIEHAVVELYRAGVSAPVRSRALGAGGTLRMAGISAGDWVLSVLSSGRAPLVRGFSIEAEGDYELGTIELDRAVALSGRLVGPDGRPLGNRGVRWSRTDPAPRMAGAYDHDSTRTDSGGVFALPDVPAGRILLLAGGDEFAVGKFEISADTAGGAVELQLSEGLPVEFVLAGREGEDAAFDLEVRDDEGQLLATRMGAAGRVTRVVLAAGNYVARANRAGQTLVTHPFRVSDRPLHVDLDRD